MPIPAAAIKGAQALYKFGKGAKAASDFILQLGEDVDKTAKKIIHFADTIGGRWVELNDIAFKTARTMAMSREQAIRYNEQLLKSTKELATQYGVTSKELADFQKSYSEAIGRNVVLTREQLAHMSALSKITDDATAAQLVDEFDKIGISIKSGLANVGHMQEKAKAFGINATKASKALASNIQLASRYSFKNGVADIEKMSLQSAAFRANMEAVMRSSEKFANIEDALQTSAKLQMLGGGVGLMGANPMGNMYNALADPAKYQEDLIKMAKSLVSYDKGTGETKMNPVQAMTAKAAADALGISVNDISQMGFAARKDEAVMAQMGEKAKGFTPEQLEAIKNLSRGNFNAETGKYEISWVDAYGEHTKNVEDITQEELKIAQDSQATEENMMMDVKDIKTILERVHGRARETKSVKETEQGIESWWDAQVISLQNIWMKPLSGLYNGISNWLGKQHYAEGGIVKPIHAEVGTVVPGSSYYGDRVPAMVNSGEMILNQKQQKSMFNLISSLALNGGAMYGMNKLGGKFGYGGLGSTMLLANMLGGGQTDVTTLIEAHFIKKAIKSMNPLKTSISEIGKVSEAATESTTTFSNRWKDLTSTLSKDFSSIANKISTATKTYFSTGRWGKITRGTSQVASAIANKASHYGGITAAHAKTIGEWIGKYTVKPIAKGTKWLYNTKPMVGARGWVGYNAYQAKLGYNSIVKPKAQEYSKLIKNLFNDGSAAQASKAASRLQTPEIAMTGKSTGITNISETASKETSSIAKAAGKGGKLLSGLGKAGKLIGKKLPYIGTALAIGGAVSGMMDASSQYDAKIDEIEKSGMSERDKARAKDRATREKNANMGGSVGSAAGGLGGMAAGAAAGAAIGSVVPIVGTAIGGLIGGALGAWGGEALGNTLGKGVGSLFGGSEEEKYLEEQKEHAKAIAGGNEEIVKVLKSIEGKMPTSAKVSSNFGLKPLEGPEIISKGLGSVLKVLPGIGGLIGGSTAPSGPTEVKLNVSGTIKLEGNGKTADIDFNKLLENPEFVRKLTETISSRMRAVSDSGKPKGGNGNYDMSKMNR